MDDKLELLLSGRHYKKLQELYLSKVLEEYHLNMVDVRVLLFLHEHEQFDTAKDIVEMHFLAKSYVSKSIENLIERGMLIKKHQGKDRRYVHLLLQEQAKPVIEAVSREKQKMVDNLFSGITAEQQMVMREIAATINHNIIEMLHEGKCVRGADQKAAEWRSINE